MNQAYSDFGMPDDDGELPRANRYSGIPCPCCGVELPTLYMLERHEKHCGKSSRFAQQQFLELIGEAQARRMAGDAS